MTWKLLDRGEVLVALAGAKKNCIRYLMLGPEAGEAPDAGKLAEIAHTTDYGSLNSCYRQRYSLLAYDTNPATVVVTDETSNETIAAYVWCGKGGTIANARDVRLIQLTEALAREFSGEQAPSHWCEPHHACPECGTVHDGTYHGSASIAEVQVSDNLRVATESLELTDWFTLVGAFASDAQLGKAEEMMAQGWLPGPLDRFQNGAGPGRDLFLVGFVNGDGEGISIFPDGHTEVAA